MFYDANTPFPRDLFSTFIGGLVAIKNKDRPHLIMGFTAGVLIGVVSFDILPEIIEQVQEHGLGITGVMVALVMGFLLFHILEKASPSTIPTKTNMPSISTRTLVWLARWP